MTNASLGSVFSVPVGVTLAVLLGFVFLALAVLVVVVIQFGTRLRYLASPVYDRIVKEAEEKARQIVNVAEEQARVALENAKAAAVKASSDQAQMDEQMRQEQNRHLEEITKRAEELLNKQALSITQLSEAMASAFGKQMRAAETVLERETSEMQGVIASETKRVQETFSNMAAKVDDDYAQLVNETGKKLEAELNGEVQAAREAVKAYREERMALLNKEIVRIVEDTARIALHTVLSLEQHRDIVIAALEEAKQQNVFAK
jgi:uncharacterized protein (UPF0333 family)